nr:class B sortase [Oscillospiraceae bacterium]
MLRLFLRVCNAAVNLVTALALLLCGSYGAYALWDNNQILTAASDVRADLQKLKPAAVEEVGRDNTAAFQELRKINPDVCGWITMEGTGVDFPVLHGENNLTYISRDVYGNFSLAGSIFLDSRNDPSFSEPYTLLYGHHMAEGNMFGDLDKYKEEGFFRENTTGQLILPEQTWDLEVIACLLVSAADQRIFDPEAAGADLSALLDCAQQTALQLNSDGLLQAEETKKVIALSTCSSEFTDARTVVLAVMEPALPGE